MVTHLTLLSSPPTNVDTATVSTLSYNTSLWRNAGLDYVELPCVQKGHVLLSFYQEDHLISRFLRQFQSYHYRTSLSRVRLSKTGGDVILIGLCDSGTFGWCMFGFTRARCMSGEHSQGHQACSNKGQTPTASKICNNVKRLNKGPSSLFNEV